MVEAKLDVLYDDDLQAYAEQLAAHAEAFLASIGKDRMEIYRIEKFEPVRQAKEVEGKFHIGDSYVIVKDNDVNYDIHYWHGNEATADEMGSSAAFSVQISGVLPKSSRHHLEEQGYETDLFQSYFKSGLFYLPGGIESGFKKATELHKSEPTLYLVKGKRYARVFTMPLEANSLNDGDCFILDMGEKIYNWHGAEASLAEKKKACDLADGIRCDERMMNATIYFPQQLGGEVEEEFWSILGGKPDKINPPIPDDQPAATEEEYMMKKLWHLSDDSGKLTITEVTERPLKREHLKDDDTFILELYNKVYVWQGKDSNKREKQMGIKYARDFVKENNKPKGTQISRVPQGCEDTHFKSFFENFYPMVKQDFGADTGTTANQDISKVAQQQARAKELLFDKLGKNWTKKVYYLEDFTTLVEITDPAEKGKFFAESNYIIDVTGETGHRYTIRWFGPRSTVEQLQAAAKATEELYGGTFTSDDTQYSVKKGHEDETFLSLFPEGFAILDEARIPMADWNAKTAENGVMFRVQAPFGGSARSIEQNARSAEYLNSGDAFVVFMPNFESAFVWHGPGANDDEKKAAQQLFDLFQKPAAIETMDEGQESEAFWASIGGKAEYSHVKESNMVAPPDFEPRLFSVSNSSGYMWMNEVPQFQQEDLINFDCFILDAFSTIFVW